jgi:hypothetical protein
MGRGRRRGLIGRYAPASQLSLVGELHSLFTCRSKKSLRNSFYQSMKVKYFPDTDTAIPFGIYLSEQLYCVS